MHGPLNVKFWKLFIQQRLHISDDLNPQ